MKKYFLLLISLIYIITSHSQSYVGFKNSTEQKIKVQLRLHFAYIKTRNRNYINLSHNLTTETKLAKELSVLTLLPLQENLKVINQEEEIFAIEVISDQAILDHEKKHSKKNPVLVSIYNKQSSNTSINNNTILRFFILTEYCLLNNRRSNPLVQGNKFLTINGKYTKLIAQGDMSVYVEKYRTSINSPYQYRLIYRS